MEKLDVDDFIIKDSDKIFSEMMRYFPGRQFWDNITTWHLQNVVAFYRNIETSVYINWNTRATSTGCSDRDTIINFMKSTISVVTWTERLFSVSVMWNVVWNTRIIKKSAYDIF